MIALIALALQTAPPAPDIQLDARVQARRVTVQRSGEASLTVNAQPDARSRVEVQGRPESRRRTYRNVDIRVRAEASVGSPTSPASESEAQTETAQPE